MKRLMLAGALMLTAAPVSADGQYWVVGNNATQRCDIVTSNPVIGGIAADNGGGYWFGDGPYRSRDDAKLARSTISACPKNDDEQDTSDNEK
ncbi:hypothetical protein [Bradyrhizobium sp.]|uniref:hypothetical protein n=1 Tax=Bradyrhizobium sp. TaxID=376 RepID=UPI002D5C8115|nr:hypothetical protein [Bradyrhizobium sp.]HZR75471.1 hypothetical protein [Bradyrhizobium sp.]